jgi:hypothetical protein
MAQGPLEAAIKGALQSAQGEVEEMALLYVFSYGHSE